MPEQITPLSIPKAVIKSLVIKDFELVGEGFSPLYIIKIYFYYI